jgi:hypothetical protein
MELPDAHPLDLSTSKEVSKKEAALKREQPAIIKFSYGPGVILCVELSGVLLSSALYHCLLLPEHPML